MSHEHHRHGAETFNAAFSVGIALNIAPAFTRPTKVVHVGFDDPPKLAKAAATEEETLSHYRRVRDEIRHFVETRLSELVSATRSPAKSPE